MASSSQAEKNNTILMIQKWGGMLVLFLIIVAINVSGGVKADGSVKGKATIPVYLFGVGSWLVLLIGTIIREQIQDKHDEDFMEFLPNALMTTIYFGFVVNAISVKQKFITGGSKRGGSVDTDIRAVGRTGLDFSRELGKYFSTTIYLAIFMVIINTIGNLYSFENCGDDENKYVKSLLNAQYNIIAISVLGAIAFVLVRKEVKKNS